MNAATLTNEGIDATVDYSYTTQRWGDFRLNATYSHVLDTRYKVFPEDDLAYVRDIWTDWRSRVRGSVNWFYKDFSTTLFGERFGSNRSADNLRGVPGRDLGPEMYWNLSVAAAITDRASVSFIVNNLFDEGPKGDDTDTAWPYFNIFTYGQAVVGREYYAQFRYRWDY